MARLSDLSDLSDRFGELVWDNDEVCRNCYRRRADVYERNYFNNNGRPQRIRASLEDITLDEHYPTTRAVAARRQPTHGVTGCCECGAISRTTYDRPAPKHRVIELLLRAIRWYERSNLRVDGPRAMARLLDGLRDPDNQHKQDAVIDAAIEASLASTTPTTTTIDNA